MTVRISAVGSYVPDTVIDNDQISAWTGKDADWIRGRTGIGERRYADRDSPTSDLAYRAVIDLRENHPGALDGVSRIILATSTGDRPQPPTSAYLQARLKLPGVACCDINSVCTGFLSGLDFAEGLALRGEKVLLVAADKYSGIMNRSDPKTVSLFGDGAGAAIIEQGTDPAAGLRSLVLATHGERSDLVTVPAGGSETPRSADPDQYTFQMQGKEVKEYALSELPPVLERACELAGIDLRDIAVFLAHQANTRLLETIAKGLDVSTSLWPMTAPRYGNTGAASLPLTLTTAQREGWLTPGRPVALLAVGGGMSVGAGIYIP